MLTTKHAIRQPLAALGPPLLRHTDILPQGKRSHTVILAELSPPSLRHTISCRMPSEAIPVSKCVVSATSGGAACWSSEIDPPDRFAMGHVRYRLPKGVDIRFFRCFQCRFADAQVHSEGELGSKIFGRPTLQHCRCVFSLYYMLVDQLGFDP